MASSTANAIYAELLSNIRQVSVIAVLHSPSNSTTKADLSGNRRLFILSHDGEETTLVLPSGIASGFRFPPPSFGQKEVSWRLPLAVQQEGPLTTDFSDTVVTPWPARNLIESSELSCRKCDTVIVSRGSVKVWKDLPSENWAEMMDFWHCHKPSLPKGATKGTAEQPDLSESKAYGANHKFTASSGVGFVDLTYVLLSKQDCLAVSETPQTTASHSTRPVQPLLCQNCRSVIGVRDDLAVGNRLYKWSLSIVNSRQRRTSYALSNFIVAYLLSMISAQAVNKFVIHAPASNVTTNLSPIIYIWVFAPYITVSFSSGSKSGSSTHAGSDTKIIPATKLFYNSITASMQESLLDNSTLSVEEVIFPQSVVEELYSTLSASTARLPPSARKFREWNVGLLERYVQETE